MSASAASVREVEPRVAVACVVCGGTMHEAICSAADVRAQRAYLRRFHCRRLRPAAAQQGERALADRAEFTQDDDAAIVRCSSCGHVFRQYRPRADAITEEYAEDAYGHDRLRALFDSQLELFRTKTERVARLMPARAGPSIVEVGSFVGGFLVAARERGWDAVGVDPGEEVGAFCRAQGLTVHRTTAGDAPIAAGSADCVAIWNTFDQLPDPRPTLSAARRWLRRDGVLAVRVPNGAGFRAAIAALHALPSALRGPILAAMAWNNLLGFPYLHGYSIDTLDRLLAPFGLQRVAVDPDVLTRIADAETKTWAAWEERLMKWIWRAVARGNGAVAPWFDAYYRVAEG